jgi:exopolysaccharide biosynthesis polyprenyl glycosylphosphotransferase
VPDELLTPSEKPVRGAEIGQVVAGCQLEVGTMAIALAVFEAGAVSTAFFLALLLQASWGEAVPRGLDIPAQLTFLCVGLLGVFYYNDLYDPRAVRNLADFGPRFGRSIVLYGIILLAASYALPSSFECFECWGAFTAITFALVLPFRAAWYAAARERTFAKRVLILGSGSMARRIADEIQSGPALGYALVGLLRDDAGDDDVLPANSRARVGRVQDAADLVAETKPDVIVVALSERRGKLPVANLLDASTHGVWVEEGAEFYERLTRKMAIENLSPSLLVFSRAFRKSRLLLSARRAASLLIAIVGIVVTAPLLVAIAVLIKLESRGPVFFRQRRVGLSGRVFELVKFRTMHEGDSNPPRSVWERDDSGRVTRLGYWLRKLRLDELPQFINILRGDMDVVGPRPEMAENIGTMSRDIPYYPLRHVVRPGVTGWAQVRYGYAVSREEVAEKTRYDLYYIKHMSFAFDLRILLDTAKIVAFRRGAR